MRRIAWIILGGASLFLCLAGIAGLVYTTRQKKPPTTLSATARVKIATGAEGIYQVASDDLEQFGIDLNRQPVTLQLLNLEQQQPYWIVKSGNRQYLRFYAQPSASRYARENIYWLVQDQSTGSYLNGKLVQAPDSVQLPDDSPLRPTGELPPHTGWSIINLEQDMVYTPLVEIGDHWFWQALPGPSEYKVTIDLPGAVSGLGLIRVHLWAGTASEVSPDHHFRLLLNQQVIADERWDGKGWWTIKTALAEGLLNAGDNALTLLVPGDTGAPAETLYLNSIEIGYTRSLSVGLLLPGDQATFILPGGPVQVDGLTFPVDIYDITKVQNPILVGSYSTGPVDFSAKTFHTYLIQGPDAYLSPVNIIQPTSGPDLADLAHGADYLVIGPADLLEAAQPLLDWRKQQGLSVLSVNSEWLADAFGSGLLEPESIRRFMQYAISHWQTPPRYLLLVGSATYDPRNYLAAEKQNRLPTFFVQTIYGGETASDLGYIILDGEYWDSSQSYKARTDLSIALGRLPAQNVQQVQNLVNKIIAYERSKPDDWQQRILAIADTQEAGFADDGQNFLDNFKSIYQTQLFVPTPGEVNIHEQIVDQINSGYRWIAYFGHGSLRMMGKDRLLSMEDVAVLRNNPAYPVMFHFTCLTGLFSYPKSESIAEALLWKANAGAVAVLAPTSLTLPTDQSYLSQGLARALIENPGLRLGDVLNLAREQLPLDDPGALDVLNTFLLLGDPALRLTIQK